MTKKSKKKERTIYHITVGNSDYTPTKKELDNIAAMFKAANVDDSFLRQALVSA